MGETNVNKKMNNANNEILYKSNFKLIETTFADVIMNVNDKDQSGLPSKISVTRKTYKFIDNSFLSITERYTNRDEISYYNYDWYNIDKSVRMKFHSEPHEDENYQTETEPYHIHKPDKFGLKEKRMPNYEHKSLFEIMELIRLIIR